MKKIKFIVATLFVSFSLASVPAIAGPTVKTPPQAASVAAEQSLSEWFYSLFDL